MSFLRRLLSELLVMQPEDIDENTTLFKLGLDSMVAMSLNNGIFQATKLRLSVVSLLSEATSLNSLANTIIEHMNSQQITKHVDERAMVENSPEHLSYFDEQVTFMQRRVLDSYRDHPSNSGFISEFNFEFSGFKVHKKEWKMIIALLFERRSELRTIYIQEKSNGTLQYIPHVVSMEELATPLKFVSFENVFDKKNEDLIFDLTKDVSVRFLIGTEKRVSRINIQLHIVTSDLKAISLILEELGLCMRQILGNTHLQKPALPNIPLTVKQDLYPMMEQMKQFWKTILLDEVEPFTFTGNTFNKLDEAFWKEVTFSVPDQLIEQIKQFLKQKGLTLYNFVMSVYMVVLYRQTSKALIPILTNYDIRAHVPALRNVITRCVNEIPVVGEVTVSTTVDRYLRACADRFNTIAENGSYPFELIQKQMQSETLRQFVSRHKLTMEDLSVLNALTKSDGYTIRIQNVAHRRKCYETCLYVYHDLKERKMIFEYGYNSEALDDKRAALIVNNIISAMQMVVENHEIKVGIIVSALQFENNVGFSFSSTDQPTKTFEACCKTENSFNSKANERETSTLIGKQITTGTDELDEVLKEGIRYN
jgi:acyl carrier protein